MQDKYHVEWWTTDGKRLGMDVSSYDSHSVIEFIKQITPNSFDSLAQFPTKIDSD